MRFSSFFKGRRQHTGAPHMGSSSPLEGGGRRIIFIPVANERDSPPFAQILPAMRRNSEHSAVDEFASMRRRRTSERRDGSLGAERPAATTCSNRTASRRASKSKRARSRRSGRAGRPPRSGRLRRRRGLDLRKRLERQRNQERAEADAERAEVKPSIGREGVVNPSPRKRSQRH